MYKVGDKVFVADWMQQYTDFYRWKNGQREVIWGWETIIPNYSSTTFHWKIVTEPKLTQKGVPFKDGSTVEKDRIPLFKDYEYEVMEWKTIPPRPHVITGVMEDETRIYLLASTHNPVNRCWVQIEEKGLTTLNKEDREKVKALEIKQGLLALTKENLGKWKKGDDLKKFPEELIKQYYDADQRVQFGSAFTRGVVTYQYIPKEFTVDGIPLFISSSVLYNGEGCDLTNKNVVRWCDLPDIFKNNTFR